MNGAELARRMAIRGLWLAGLCALAACQSEQSPAVDSDEEAASTGSGGAAGAAGIAGMGGGADAVSSAGDADGGTTVDAPIPPLSEDAALEPIAAPDPNRELPDAIWLKDTTETYNRLYYFAIRNGVLFAKPNLEQAGTEGPWQELTLPAGLAGDVAGVSADDSEVVAIDSQRRIWTMTGGLGPVSDFAWKTAWGAPIWTGPGFEVMEGTRDWVWTVLSRGEDDHFVDRAGNPQLVGLAKVSHIWQLSADGHDITYIDPWLPNDYSYQMCGPRRGRFEALAITGSGSTTFVIDAYGEMYTRLYDFDISGADTVFFRYSYEDQRGNTLSPPIQLPAPDWIRHPKINGRITDRIGMHKLGKGAVHRTMRVEGEDPDGHSGYFEKDLTDMDAASWVFHRTDQPLKGRFFLDNRPEAVDAAAGPDEDLHFALDPATPQAPGSGLTFGAELLDFNVYCSPATLRIHLEGGEVVDLVLHNVDGLRQQGTREPGLDGVPRAQEGAIEVPQSVLESTEPAVQAFVSSVLSGQRFSNAPITATADEVAVTVGLARWAFQRVQ